LIRIAGLGIEQASLQIERVGEAVGRVNAHDQGAVAEFGKLQPGSGRQTRFPYTALAAEEQDAHAFILSTSVAGPDEERLFLKERDSALRSRRGRIQSSLARRPGGFCDDPVVSSTPERTAFLNPVISHVSSYSAGGRK